MSYQQWRESKNFKVEGLWRGRMDGILDDVAGRFSKGITENKSTSIISDEEVQLWASSLEVNDKGVQSIDANET